MKPQTKQMSLEYDSETDALLEELKSFFGVKTKSAVIKRALAIARQAKRYADSDKSVRISKPRTRESETFSLGG